MTKKLVIQQPSKEVKEKIEAAINRSNLLLIKKNNDQHFHLLSKKNYGSISTIEKEYYNIRGQLKSQGTQTELSYEIKANSTYWIMGFVLPIMFLPTIFLSAIDGDKSNLLQGLMLYLVLSAIVIFWTWQQHKKLIKMGQQDFQTILKVIDIQS